MNQSAIYLILCTMLFGCEVTRTESIHDEACSKIQKEGTASCFDRSTLGFCMFVAGEWRAIEAATCDKRLCCNAKLMGCTMNADCRDELTTVSTTISTSTGKPSATCSIGNLRKHESDCKRFYYCSRNVWVESECSAGVFDDVRMSCVFGSCRSF